MKATEQYFPVVLFIMLYKVVLPFESVDEILNILTRFEISQVQMEDWGRVFKFTFHQKLESITRKITLKLGSLPSLIFCR